MNFTTAMGFSAGLLQFVVAGYALRLNRLFGTRRVGWSLFWAFLLLALLHLLQSVMERGAGEQIGIKIDAMNVLISMLLLIGMVHLEGVLKERLRVEIEEQRMRSELENEVKKKTAYLTRALEGLQAEIDERKRVESEAQSARWELDIVSRRADMAQITSAVLRSVGEMLNNVQSAENLAVKQPALLQELQSIKANLEKIKAMEQDCVNRSAEPASMNTVAV
ncbi:MAG TPA: hypothetical protein VMO20_02485 [Candidatus Acidoferrum sp.]|nr:hypothetical protein [Candidatus Acidoferrum sp.]